MSRALGFLCLLVFSACAGPMMDPNFVSPSNEWESLHPMSSAATESAPNPASNDAVASHADASRSIPAPDPNNDIVLRACGPGSSVLHEMARRVIHRAIEGKPAWTMVELGQGLRERGEPHPGARAWMLSAPRVDRQHATQRLKKWLGTRGEKTPLRCGVASLLDSERGEVLAVVTVPVFAELRVPMPEALPQGRWVTVDAQMKQEASGANVVVLGPRGSPRTIPTSYDPATRRILGRFMADREGPWIIQVVATVPTGPRPVIETQLLVGSSKGRSVLSAPGERAGQGLPHSLAMIAKLNVARASEGLQPLRVDASLQRLAEEHVRDMINSGVVGHDAGRGTPPQRAAEAGVTSSDIGENVSRATSTTLAHRALWGSPSHRANTLHPRYERVGVAVRKDDRGLLWVAQIFAGREAESMLFSGE